MIENMLFLPQILYQAQVINLQVDNVTLRYVSIFVTEFTRKKPFIAFKTGYK